MHLENQHQETDIIDYPTIEDSSSRERSAGRRSISGRAVGLLGVGAVTLGVGAGAVINMLDAQPQSAAAEKPQFEYVTDLPQDIQDGLLHVQASYTHDPTLSPANIPNVTLNQVGQQSFTIVEAYPDGSQAGGLAEQAEHAYLTEHGGQAAPQSVQDSITVTTKALTKIHHLEKKSDVIHKDDSYVLIELKDAEGTDLVVVSPEFVDKD